MPRIYLDQRGAGGYERPQRGGVRAGEAVGPDEREGGVASGEAGPREAAAEAAGGAHHQDPAPRPRRVLRHRRPAPRLATAGKVTGAWTGWGAVRGRVIKRFTIRSDHEPLVQHLSLIGRLGAKFRSKGLRWECW